MKWLRIERENAYQRASGIIIVETAIGWECTNCHLTHWTSPERPGRPEGGCWGCGQRDEEYGKDAPSEGPRGREVLGTIHDPRD